MKEIANILKSFKTIGVVGLSDKPERPSYDVASYLAGHGYRIIPVNPMIKDWKGMKAYHSLAEAKHFGENIEIVDIFRKSEDVPPVVDEAIAIGAKVVWMQLGVVNDEAAKKAKMAGLRVVMNRCIKIEHAKIMFH